MAESLAPPLHKDPGIQGRRRPHPPVRCRDMGSLLEADQATGAVLAILLALLPWHQMARPCVERRRLQESQPAQHSPSCLRCSRAGLATSQGWKTYACPQQSSSASSKKESTIIVLQKKCYKDHLKRQLAHMGINPQSWQQEASDRDSWCSSVRKASREFQAERHKPTKEKRRRQKE